MMMKIHLSSMSSYPGGATSSQPLEIQWPFPEDLTAQRVLIVDDILDSAPLNNFVCRDADADSCDDCSGGNDKDNHGGYDGWWFFLNFTAENVPWTGL